MSLFTRIRNALTAFLKPVEQSVIDLGTVGLSRVATILKAEGIAAVKAAVAAAEARGGSGNDKYNAARKALENRVKNANIPESIINLAIELAVQALKA